MTRLASMALPFLLLAACQPQPADEAEPGWSDAAEPTDTDPSETLLGPEETLRFTGTEPFWGGEVTGAELRYTTPEDIDGTTIPVERFTGLGGIAFSGQLSGDHFEMTVTPLACSDGMSDRSYPFTVTLRLGEETRHGCGWTERQPFEGPANP